MQRAPALPTGPAMKKAGYKNQKAGKAAHIYGLRLKGGKFYCGRTTLAMSDRYEQHRAGTGAAWTRIYPPEEICFDPVPEEDNKHETYQTIELMASYGICNVRGGIYTSVKLSVEDVKTIWKDICDRKNRCRRCGDPNHFIGQCLSKVDVCYCCGHYGHWIRQCPENVDVSKKFVPPLPAEHIAEGKEPIGPSIADDNIPSSTSKRRRLEPSHESLPLSLPLADEKRKENKIVTVVGKEVAAINGTKQCGTCKKVLSNAEFTIHVYAASGVLSNCKKCVAHKSKVARGRRKIRTADEVEADCKRLRPNGLKKCRKCFTLRGKLPLIDFSVNIAERDGRNPHCNVCLGKAEMKSAHVVNSASLSTRKLKPQHPIKAVVHVVDSPPTLTPRKDRVLLTPRTRVKSMQKLIRDPTTTPLPTSSTVVSSFVPNIPDVPLMPGELEE